MVLNFGITQIADQNLLFLDFIAKIKRGIWHLDESSLIFPRRVFSKDSEIKRGKRLPYL